MTEAHMMGMFVFIAGAIVGSFLNVCIVRWPQEKSIVTPGSHCVHCQHPIAWYDNIPFISYLLLLRARCRYCHERISPRYVFVELITAAFFFGMYLYVGWQALLLPYLYLMACFIVTIFVDFKHRIIPDEVTIYGMIAGLVFSFFIPELHGVYVDGIVGRELALGKATLGLFIGGGSVYLMGVLGDLLFRKESMGGGDVKLMAMVGAFLGWKLALLTFFVAPFFGAVYGIIEKLRTQDNTIAYGPFLVMGALVSLFWGDRIIQWIMSGYGLY